jgi:CRP-like cAMP-binding protein/Zn-dependent protease
VKTAPTRPGLWGRLESAAQTHPAPEGDGRLWDRLSDMVDAGQFRPKLADDIELKEFKNRWGNDYAMIANPRELLHYRLEPGEVELLKLMDGTRSVKEIVLERFKESGDLELSGVADLVRQLQMGNFLTQPYLDVDAAVTRSMVDVSHARQKGRQFAKTLSVEWSNADRLVKWFYNHGVRHFFKKWVLYAMGGVALAGFVAFVSVVNSNQFSLSDGSLAIGFLLLLVLNYFLTFVHELGHAVVLTHNGRKIKSAGFMIYFGSPAFFVDSSDGLMMDRSQRMAQSFAGPYAEIILAGTAAIVAWAVPDWAFSPTLYKFAVLNYLVIFLNLVPFLELDGYWLLSDLIQVPELRPMSLSFIRHDMWHKLRIRDRFSKQEVGLALYGIVGVLFTIFSFYTAYYFWQQIFGGLVRRMWHGGTVPRLLLLLLAAVVGGPVIRGAGNFFRLIYRRLRAVWLKIRFRLETKWRVEAAALIDKLPMFDELPEDVLSDLAGRVSLRTFAKGQPVVRQGDRAEAFFLVRTGTLQVVDQDEKTGNERVLRTLGRGESFGELGLVQGSPRAATVRAVEESQVFEIDKGTFDRLLADMIHVPEFAPTLQAVSELRELPSFAYLEPDELTELLELGEWVNVQPGEIVVEQGAVGDAFYAIRSGQVDIVKDGEVVNTLGPGQFFGEVALLLDVPRTATVRARTPVRAYRLTREGFDRLIARAFKKGTLNPQMPQDRTWQH